MPRRKSNCATEGCKGVATLHTLCLACRKKNCAHTETHYDSNLALVCDNCGDTVKVSTKKKGRNMVGRGKKAYWQQNCQLTSKPKALQEETA